MNRALTDLQRKCILAMVRLDAKHNDRYGHTMNCIGDEIGDLLIVHQRKWRSGVKGSAQRIIRPITTLRERGLVDFASRRDHSSGTAYALTDDGRALADQL